MAYTKGIDIIGKSKFYIRVCVKSLEKSAKEGIIKHILKAET